MKDNTTLWRIIETYAELNKTTSLRFEVFSLNRLWTLVFNFPLPSPQVLGLKKIWVQKRFWSKKIIGSKKMLGPKKIYVHKILGKNIFRSKKIRAK